MLTHDSSSLLDVGTVVALTVFLSILVTTLLWRPLVRLLSEVCGSPERAEFWALYSTLFLFILPLLIVTATSIEGDIARFVRLTIFFANFGIAAALVVVGYAIWSRIPGSQSGEPQ